MGNAMRHCLKIADGVKAACEKVVDVGSRVPAAGGVHILGQQAVQINPGCHLPRLQGL